MKKLELKKEVVSRLNDDQMQQIHGGADTVEIATFFVSIQDPLKCYLTSYAGCPKDPKPPTNPPTNPPQSAQASVCNVCMSDTCERCAPIPGQTIDTVGPATNPTVIQVTINC